LAKTINQSDLTSFLKEYHGIRRKFLKLTNKFFEIRKEKEFDQFEGILLKDQKIYGADLQAATFNNCTFINVEFIQCSFYMIALENCTFNNCTIRFSNFVDVECQNVRFNFATITETTFADIRFIQTIFSECPELSDLRFSSCPFVNSAFLKCTLAHVAFDYQLEQKHEAFAIEDCYIARCAFDWMNFENVSFSSSAVSYCSFTNCQISPNTILDNNNTPKSEFNSIDFQTILRSNISFHILEKLFGIHSPDIKSYVMEMVSKVELHTVFISYSFKDNTIANLLNEALKKRGVMTFLWQKDAPGGKRLKQIMSTYVNKFDKVLFIASKNSLKSEACHFELTNGRKKQDKNWDLVLFPIHIDNFLFSVSEEDIPRKNRVEFWTNIEELREINSMDFGPFTRENIDPEIFDQQMDKLIKGLRKENQE